MTERTVTVATADRGIITIPEPAWCTGTPHDLPDDLVHRPLASEIAHLEAAGRVRLVARRLSVETRGGAR